MELVSVRAAHMDGCAGIHHIHRDADDPWSNALECEAWVEKRLQRGFYVQIACVGGVAAGHGEWIVNDTPEGRYLYLGVLEIDPDYQRKGIGGLMLADGARYARQHACRELVTIPESSNTSSTFYEKCGFSKRRVIMSCRLDTAAYGGIAYARRVKASSPLSMAQSLPFIFGLGQISSRHMWEICNEKPRTDLRKSPALMLDNGGAAQLLYAEGSDTALALYWGVGLDARTVQAIQGFGYHCGLRYIDFRFFIHFANMFVGQPMDAADIEMYKPV